MMWDAAEMLEASEKNVKPMIMIILEWPFMKWNS
jgi:hypothetical protein